MSNLKMSIKVKNAEGYKKVNVEGLSNAANVEEGIVSGIFGMFGIVKKDHFVGECNSDGSGEKLVGESYFASGEEGVDSESVNCTPDEVGLDDEYNNPSQNKEDLVEFEGDKTYPRSASTKTIVTKGTTSLPPQVKSKVLPIIDHEKRSNFKVEEVVKRLQDEMNNLHWSEDTRIETVELKPNNEPKKEMPKQQANSYYKAADGNWLFKCSYDCPNCGNKGLRYIWPTSNYMKCHKCATKILVEDATLSEYQIIEGYEVPQPDSEGNHFIARDFYDKGDIF